MTTFYRSAAVLAALSCFGLFPAFAEPITISTESNGITVSGELLSFDGRFLQLETEAGVVTMKAEGVTCTGESCPDFENFVPRIRISGAARLGELLLPALIEGYARSEGLQVEREEGEIVSYSLSNVDGDVLEVTIRSTTSDQGFIDLLEANADLVMSAREIRTSEVESLREAGLGHLDQAGHSKVIALDSLVPVTGVGQGVQDVSMSELAAVFSGQITDWGALGGQEGLPIHLYLPSDHSGFAQGLLERLTGTETVSVSLFREDNTETLADVIAADPQALGVLPSRALGSAVALGLVGECGLRSVPRVTAVKTEDYPLSFPLFIYIPERPLAPAVDAMLDWFRTADAQLVVRRAGFVDQGAVPIGLEVQGERLANAILSAGEETSLATLKTLVSDMYTAVRLSPTFRFQEGYSDLDIVSRSSLMTLAQGLLDGRYYGQKLKFVGFSDGAGPAEANQSLSEARALSVLNDLLVMLGGELPSGVVIQTVGYGEALPIGCDESRWGRQVNRRVELWLENAPAQVSQ